MICCGTCSRVGSGFAVSWRRSSVIIGGEVDLWPPAGLMSDLCGLGVGPEWLNWVFETSKNSKLTKRFKPGIICLIDSIWARRSKTLISIVSGGDRGAAHSAGLLGKGLIADLGREASSRGHPPVTHWRRRGRVQTRGQRRNANAWKEGWEQRIRKNYQKNFIKIIWDSLPEAGVADLEGVFLSDMSTLAASRSWAVNVDMWGEGGIGVVVTSEATDEGGLELLEDREVFGSFLSLKCREQNPLRWLSFIQSPFEHNRRHCFPLNFFRTPVF